MKIYINLYSYVKTLKELKYTTYCGCDATNVLLSIISSLFPFEGDVFMPTDPIYIDWCSQ